MNIARLKFILFFCLGLLSSRVSAQVGPMLESVLITTSINPRSPAWAKSGYLQVPFNLSAQKLAANFKGHSTAQIYASLDDAATQKGKYETTAQYEDRLVRMKSRPLFHRVQLSSPVAFTVGPSWCDYNADTQKMRVHFAFLEALNIENQSSQKLSIVTQSVEGTPRSYTAQNGFGAQVQVTSTSRTAFGFAVTNPDKFWFARIGEDQNYREKFRFTVDASVTPSAAPMFERDVRGLFLCHIAMPGKGMDVEESHNATFNSPYETISIRNYVCVRLKQVWIYNSKTGVIYGKMNPRGSETKDNETKGSETKDNETKDNETKDNVISY